MNEKKYALPRDIREKKKFRIGYAIGKGLGGSMLVCQICRSMPVCQIYHSFVSYDCS